MNDIRRDTAHAMETGMQQAYVQLLHAMIKENIKNPSLLVQADRLLEQSNTANERAKAKAKEIYP